MEISKHDWTCPNRCHDFVDWNEDKTEAVCRACGTKFTIKPRPEGKMTYENKKEVVMPGNLVVINGSEELTWYVGDSKMDELMEFLHKVGSKGQPNVPLLGIKDGEAETCAIITADYCKECDKLRILDIKDSPVP